MYVPGGALFNPSGTVKFESKGIRFRQNSAEETEETLRFQRNGLSFTAVGAALVGLSAGDVPGLAIDLATSRFRWLGELLPKLKWKWWNRNGSGIKPDQNRPKLGGLSRLEENDVVVGMFKDGKVLKQVPFPDDPLLAPSHEAIAKELGVWAGSGKLDDGIEAFTVWKEGGKIHIRGSANFELGISDEAKATLGKLFE